MTIKANHVKHDARPYDGHQYRLRMRDGRVHEPLEAKSSYSGASIVFLPPGATYLSHVGIGEHHPDIVAVERLDQEDRAA